MNTITCETVRDRLPDLVRGRLDGEEARPLEAHIASCAACAAERVLVESVRGAMPALPFALEQRVSRAVRAGRPRRRVSFTGLAMAASIMFALVLAGLYGRGAGPDEGSAPSTDVIAPGDALLSGTGVPLLSGAPALHDLSVEELETLLRELES